MKIALGSTRKAKIEAVESATSIISQLGVAPWNEFEIIPCEVASGVGHTPSSDDDLMSGARNRVENLIRLFAQEGRDASIYLGLEGGLHVVENDRRRVAFLRGWVYASVGVIGEGTFGSSPSIQVPNGIAEAVLDRGENLGDVIDRFSGRVDVRSHEGTWGVLTRDLITRGKSFEVAILSALAPFFNSRFYSMESGYSASM